MWGLMFVHPCVCSSSVKLMHPHTLGRLITFTTVRSLVAVSVEPSPNILSRIDWKLWGGRALLEEELVFRGAVEKTNQCELNDYLKDVCVLFKDWAILSERCGNCSSTGTTFWGQLPFPSFLALPWLMDTLWLGSGTWICVDILCLLQKMPGLKIRPCFWKEGAQGILQKAVVISAEPMGQYPELHSGVLSCLWNETQEFRLADLFREVSGGERIILKGWLGGEGWCFCGLDKVPRISCHGAKSKCPCDGMFAKWENSIAIRLLINSKHVLWRLVTHRLIQKIGNV